ncbi:hypothetical protein [Halobacteriovorax sp. JY17]|uniref:hypothetical protein n=1 Tax=Halobacteriovorax sp. JY17 TaxID=2014617 RepID=UPI000C6233D6|nr:hypothetical protein [Halobacteriovorax sp. JY17]PIK14605.1 MAG: hypothetical protein CES88_09710 [Halobacteriovorax sp. JY17]
MKVLAPLFILLMAFTSVKAQERKKNVVYRYKQYEKFDFEDLVIEGETGGPGDLSIAPRYQKKFKNKLPYRKNFNAEIRKGVERVR